MLIPERHDSIMKVLRRNPRLGMEALQRELGVSRSTLRRDLLELEHLGEVVRLRGQVVHAEHYRGEPTFERRRGRRVEQKQAIARAAADMVPADVTVYVDAGTTCLEVGRLLMTRADVRIFTHSVRLVSEATDSVAPVTCIGGEYRAVSDALVGGLSASWLAELRFDWAFVAASGVTAEGVSTTELSETLLKQQVLRRSGRRVLVADAEKWDQPAAVRFDDWSHVDAWISDDALKSASSRLVRSLGVDLVLAS